MPAPALTPDPRWPDAGLLRAALLDWYARNGRSLPFRETTDPWAILASEAMAQQTQAARAGEAWRGFIARFPTPAALAASSPAEVLRAWRGLGYNRRAIALHRAAQAIVAEHGGRVPSDPAVLETLPGVGPYTARAVAAFAFGAPVAPVDTNVRRVLGRVTAGGEPVSAPRRLQALADGLVDPAHPGDWSHALMDLGATVCRARPDCPACPLRRWCRYAAAGPGAGEEARPRAVRGRAARFEATNRWLRGRIVDRLRDGDDGAWTVFDGPLGTHDTAAVTRALASLAREGLVELDPSELRRARLPPSAAAAVEGGSAP